MARIRSVKPEFWIDRPLARKLSRDARLLYIGMWNLADEHARLGGDPDYVKGQIFPYDGDLTADCVDKLINEIAAADKAVRYEVADEPYLFLPTLHKHQRLEADKVPSRLPPPPDPDDTPPRADTSAPRPDESASGAYKFAPVDAEPPEWANQQVTASAQIRADESAPRADSSESRADSSALLYVAGYVAQESGIENLLSATATPPPDEQPAPKSKRGRKKASAEPRPDVEALCARLVELMVANDCLAPPITDKWRTEARLMLDKDGRDFQKAMNVLEWCQKDSFWHANIHSIPKFRKQYDQLRQKAIAEWQRTSRAPAGSEMELHSGTTATVVELRPRPSATARARAEVRNAFEQARQIAYGSPA